MTETAAAGEASDSRRILGGISQNVVGILIAGVATLGAQILITRTLGAPNFGVVTVVVQALFVLSFATRAGMDMAVLREVAMGRGTGTTAPLRATVARAATIAAAVSVLVALTLLLLVPQVRALFSIDPERGRGVIQAAALGLPAIALTNVWLAATRGLKLMRHTLYVFWIGQPVLWIALMAGGWAVSRSPWMTVAAYSLSWWVAAGAAAAAWLRESRGWEREGEANMSRVARYAAPRAPAALLAQVLFWTDLFVLTRYAGELEVGVYSGALRAGQLLVLFLTSVNLMFSPYVADLHARGERERLDRLFKSLTRWTLALTLPGFLLLAVTPISVLRLFGGVFADARTALLILLAGQLVNVATGSVGFVLIMAGRTGWDLVVYSGSFGIALALAFLLVPRYGIEGAAAANAATFAVSNLARLLLVKRFVGIQPYERSFLRLIPPAGAGLAAMGLLHALGPGGWLPDLLVTGVGGVIAYGIVYLWVGVTPPERRSVRRVFSSRSPAMLEDDEA